MLGAGQMGEALISGLLRAGVVAPGEIIAAARRSDRAEQLREPTVSRCCPRRRPPPRRQTLVITVKPQDMGALLDEISPKVTPDTLIISVAAGITTGFIGRKLAGEVPSSGSCPTPRCWWTRR